MTSVERGRLSPAAGSPGSPDPEQWRLWGPYLAERAWGTVREDYSASGDAWGTTRDGGGFAEVPGAVSHDAARSKAYRWNEEGLAGVCDVQQRLCLALALWNGVDPIL